MLKLMKYELRKTAFSKLVLLVITAVAEIAFLIGVFWKKDNILAMGIIFLVMCTIFGVIYIGIESVNVLHRDLNTKQSYMLFLTPKSSYQILGAKILENGISIIMAGAFFAALAALDVTVATLYIGGLKEMINLVSSFMEENIAYLLCECLQPLILQYLETYRKLAKYSFMPILRQTAEIFLDFK